MKNLKLLITLFAASFILTLLPTTSIAQKSADIAYKQSASFDRTAQADTINPEIKFNKLRIDSITKFYYQGMHDADNNYNAKRSGKRAIFFTALIGTPVLGIIPTIVSSSTRPKLKNLNIKDASLLTNPAYMKGYKDEAHQIKKRLVWGNYVAASVTWLAIANIVLL